jgi:hypothetical protein
MIKTSMCLILLGAGSAVSFGQWSAELYSSEHLVKGITSSSAVGASIVNMQNGEYITHATIWNRDGSIRTDLHPNGATNSVVWGVNGSGQVGSVVNGTQQDAAVWHGTAESMINLGKAGWITTAMATSAFGQVGHGSSTLDTDDAPHAVFWQGTANSFVDLNPTGAYFSYATAVGSGYQAGWAVGEFGQATGHTFLWRGTAESATIMDPAGTGNARIQAGSEFRQVGGASYADGWHAVAWSGTAESAIDINPSGYSYSDATTISESGEFAGGKTISGNGLYHAFLWNLETSETFDLQNYIGDIPFTVIASQVTGVADNGDAIGFVVDQNDEAHSVRWNHVVPEPSSILAIGVGALFVLRRRKKS